MKSTLRILRSPAALIVMFGASLALATTVADNAQPPGTAVIAAAP